MQMERGEVFRHEGRAYLRCGKCQRCGECCKGFNKPCPYLIYEEEGCFSCQIHAGDNWPPDAACSGPEGMKDFPDGPQALWWDKEIFNKCGYWFVEVERVLVACPTYSGKDYCRERYLAAYEALDWPAKDLLMVRTDEHPGNGNEKIAWGMEQVRQRFLAGPYDRWLNLEADVIAPPETISVLLSYDRSKEIDWLSHYYPDRVSGQMGMSGFGCTLFSRKLMERHSFSGAPADTTTDGWFWHEKVKNDPEMKTLELWGVLQLEHLNG